MRWQRLSVFRERISTIDGSDLRSTGVFNLMVPLRIAQRLEK